MNDTHATAMNGDTVIRFGGKFWSGMFAMAWGPALACLAFFWHLSDRVLVMESRVENQTNIVERQQKTIDQLDSNREGIATAIQAIKDVDNRIRHLEDAVRSKSP